MRIQRHDISLEDLMSGSNLPLGWPPINPEGDVCKPPPPSLCKKTHQPPAPDSGTHAPNPPVHDRRKPSLASAR